MRIAFGSRERAPNTELQLGHTKHVDTNMSLRSWEDPLTRMASTMASTIPECPVCYLGGIYERKKRPREDEEGEEGEEDAD